MKNYDHKKIEKKWQAKWSKDKIYKTQDKSKKKKFYVLDMFPYPSGEGLHVGHPKGYIATDVVSRAKRMQGFNVLHPMGFDAFGLPAENYAIKNKIHPEVAVTKNIKRYKDQLQKIGLDYDWSREISTTDPKYYKWTQWIFLQMWKKGLAFESNEPINWCPSCKTGLANEDLEDGRCERCGTLVEKKPLRQWVLEITKYADRLLADLDLKDKDGQALLKWPEYIKDMQRDWIGQSSGAEIDFELTKLKEKVKVFTTRPDTIFGATYLVLAPEHPLMSRGILDIVANRSEVEAYLDSSKNKSEIERTSNDKTKTGVELVGLKAINPATKEEISVWVADYVLSGYGTGAIMAVPAHDERDFEFATKFGLEIRSVVEPLFVDSPKEDLPMVERNAVHAIVKHWEEDKYLLLKWKKVDWVTFVTGGIEEGEDPVEAAIREIQEETGYQNLELQKEIRRSHSKFYHEPKKENRFGHFHNFLFKLKDGERKELTQDENSKHEIFWANKEEVSKFIISKGGSFHDWQVIQGKEKIYSGSGILVDSGKFSGLNSSEAKDEIVKFVGGKKKTSYKIRDWVFSRQRYWGEPIPLVHCNKCGVVPVPEKDLPVKLPKVKSYEPTGTGESPLAGITKWVNTKCPKCKGEAKRETNTMPQWAGSSWYYLRFMDPKNSKVPLSKDKAKYFGAVDLYVGGAEHATRHLIYARFWHKFLFDIGLVSNKEPFLKLESVGLIMGSDGRKMSKRFGNVINPDDVIERLGADTMRLYEMFMGPFDQAISWSEDSIVGPRRFIERVWKLGFSAVESKNLKTSDKIESLLHRTIKKIGEDIDSMRFNTAVSSMMVFLNEAEKGNLSLESFKMFLQILAPFAPHTTEELWSMLGEKKSIHTSMWPRYDEAKLLDDEVKIVVQVNGKVRGELMIGVGESEESIKTRVLEDSQFQRYLIDATPKKIIYVKGRLINIVI